MRPLEARINTRLRSTTAPSNSTLYLLSENRWRLYPWLGFLHFSYFFVKVLPSGQKFSMRKCLHVITWQHLVARNCLPT